MSSSGNEPSPEAKPRSKRKAFLFLAVLLLLAGGSIFGTATGLISNVAEESRTFAVPPHGRALEVVADVAAQMKWTGPDGAGPPLRFEARTRVFGFVDDVAVTLTPVSSTSTAFRVRSASRVGLSDFGTNRRRIHEFFDRVEEKLAK